MKGIKKLLLIILTITTMGSVVLVATKVKKPDPPIYQDFSIEGKSSKLPNREFDVEGTYDEALSSISETNLKKDLYHLAGSELEGRMSGKNGNKLAAQYIEYRFKSFGLNTTRQKFRVGRYNPGPKNETGDEDSENILAYIEGNDPELKNEVVVVGAHMDHLGYGPKASQAPNRREIHPGADDNASGTVALIEIARAFSMMRKKIKRTVVFIAFSGEEMGLVGSKYYCDNPMFPKNSPSINKHIFMLNMDMIGNLKKGTYLANFSENDSSPDINVIIGELNTRYTFAKSITGRGSGGSDHAPFYNKKVPVVCLHTGMHQYYHTPDDTADKINYKGVEQIARYAFELSWRVAIDSTRPTFNYKNFKIMTYDYDHGNSATPFEKEE